MKRLSSRIKLGVIFFILAAFIAAAPCMASTMGKTNILLVFSWHKNMPWQVEIEKGLEENFKKKSLKPNLFFEYMDAGRFKNKDQPDIFKNYLSEKYKDHTIDCVIYESMPAARLFKSYPELFSSSRKFVLNPPPIKDNSPFETATIIPLNPDYKGAARELLEVSKTGTIYLVAGSLASGRARVEKMTEILTKLDPDKKIIPLVGLPMNQLLEKVSNLESNSIIFYLLVFKDGEGISQIPYDAASQISHRANAPVYSLWSVLSGSGIVGGYLLSGEMVGNELAEILMGPDLIKNIDPKSQTHKFHGFFYDWRQLKRWNIKENQLPSGSKILFKELTFYEKYYKEIIVYSLIIISLLTFFWNRRLKKEITERLKTEKNLQESENRFRSLSDAAFEGIIISNKGEIIDANSEMTVLFDYPAEKFIGMKFFSLINPDDHDKVQNEILSKSEIPHEVMGVKSNGTEFPLELHTKISYIKGQQVQVTAMRDLTEKKKAEEEIKVLKGIIPICMHCKVIRDDKGYWKQLEAYIDEHSEAEFSHSICPECLEKYHSDLDI